MRKVNEAPVWMGLNIFTVALRILTGDENVTQGLGI
jgi:hypothetical protein